MNNKIETEKCIILEEWVNAGLEVLEQEEMQEYCYGLLMYALYGETIETENRIIKMSLKAIYPNIDRMKTGYEKRISGGESNTGKYKYDPIEVHTLAQKLKNIPQIANALREMHPDIDVKPAGLYSNPGWKDKDLSLEEFCQKHKLELPKDTLVAEKEPENKPAAFLF